MDRQSFLSVVPLTAMAAMLPAQAEAQPGKLGVLYLNRIAPTVSDLYIANADGSGERKLLATTGFDFHARFTPDGRGIVFTSERNGDGQADIFRCDPDGSNLRPLVASPAVEDSAAMSPNGRTLAFVSTRDTYRANIWTMDLASGRLRNLTGAKSVQGDQTKPDGFFRPAWSPDGNWIAFSSDRNTAWRGHDDGKGWENTQELSIYVIRLDGSGFRQIATKPGYSLGSPAWSPDGKRVAYYEITTEGTWGAHRPEGAGKVSSQIVSVDVATGARIEHSQGPGLRVAAHWLAPDLLAWQIKGTADEGLAYSSNSIPSIKRQLRSPAWSPDGKLVVYEKQSFVPVRPFDKKLYSWDNNWEYRHTDVFPALSHGGVFVMTEKQLGNSSVVIMNFDGTGRRTVFNPADHGQDPVLLQRGQAGAFQPAWSPDGQWMAFGVGGFLTQRATGKAVLWRCRSDGSSPEALTDAAMNAGFPSYSADGRYIVFRVWSETAGGLRILDLQTRNIRELTNQFDNLPAWSPDGKTIAFTRKVTYTSFDVYTIRPDGTGLRQLTSGGANNAHAVWTWDGKLAYNTGAYGFRNEAALYDQTFQPYGQIFVMNADGSGKRPLTDSMWEDGMPLFVPERFLKSSA
jgi:Tol biopolymer transport system component